MISERNLERCAIEDILTVAKTIHFIIQNAICPKFLELVPEEEKLKKEKSIFDDYDRENGYEEKIENKDVWAICENNMKSSIMIAIKLLRNSYTQCLEMDVIKLLEGISGEIENNQM